MKTNPLLLLCLFLISFSTISSCAKHDISPLSYPSYESVVRFFYENHKVPPPPVQLYFEKRPEGYFVSKSLEYPFEKRIDREMIWSRASKTFNHLEYYDSSDALPYLDGMTSTHLRPYLVREFKFCPYAGYPGWQQDVIDEFGEKEYLPDTLRYGLSRAYSTFTSNLINDNFGNIDKTIQFNLPKGKNCMTKDQLKTFRKYAYAARDNFLKLHQQNPDFETVVGKIYTKYCNEIMWNFLLLQYFQNEKEARKELKADLYDPFYINAAKNYLNSCPPNAILFTYGDNDTYPLLYVQAQLGFRTDVLVANTSLLVIDRYIDHLRAGVFDAPPFPIPFDPSFYQDQKNIQIATKDPALSSNKKEPTDLVAMLQFIQNENNRSSFPYQDIPYFPSEKFTLNIDHEKIIQKNIVPETFRNSITPQMNWKLPRFTIIRNDLMLLAAIAQSNWERPICIGMTCRKETFMGLEKYFHLEGFTYRLLPVESTLENSYLYGDINEEECYQKLTKEFIWDGIDKIESGKSVYFQNYSLIFLETINRLIEKDEKENALELLDLYFKIFPNEVAPFENMATRFVKAYFLLQKDETAEKIGLQIIDNFSKKEKLRDRELSLINNLKNTSIFFESEVLQKAFEKTNW